VSILVSLLLTSSCVQDVSDPVAEREAIAEARSAFWDAHEEGNAGALAAVLTDSAVLWAPGMNEVRG